MMMMTTLEYDEIKPHKVTYCQEKAKKERRRYLRWISKNLNHPKKHLSPSTYWVRFIDNNVPHIKNLCVNYAKNCEYENALFSSVYRRLCYDRKKSTLITFGNKMSYQVNMSTSTRLCISNRQEKRSQKCMERLLIKWNIQ